MRSLRRFPSRAQALPVPIGVVDWTGSKGRRAPRSGAAASRTADQSFPSCAAPGWRVGQEMALPGRADWGRGAAAVMREGGTGSGNGPGDLGPARQRVPKAAGLGTTAREAGGDGWGLAARSGRPAPGSRPWGPGQRREWHDRARSGQPLARLQRWSVSRVGLQSVLKGLAKAGRYAAAGFALQKCQAGVWAAGRRPPGGLGAAEHLTDPAGNGGAQKQWHTSPVGTALGCG